MSLSNILIIFSSYLELISTNMKQINYSNKLTLSQTIKLISIKSYLTTQLILKKSTKIIMSHN